jgi:hypothetical protein
MQKINLNKHNIQNQWFNIVVNMPYELKLSSKDFKLLLEAFRRKNILKSEEKFFGLGFPSDYKSNLFQSSFGELRPRVMNWFCLTELGKEKMKQLEQMLSIEEGSENQVNDIFFINS